MKRAFRAMPIALLFAGASTALDADTTSLAINAPDEFNWRLFVKINVPAPNGKDRLWETWADNQQTFPTAPTRDKPPEFPAPDAVVAMKVQPIRQLRLLQAELKALGKADTMHPAIVEGGGQEVRRNKAAFDFIVAKKLYFREGIAEAFTSGERLNFPPDAVEIKAVWGETEAMSPDELKRYYTNTDSSGKRFRLLGIHVISKELPNWTWATFEHADNPGRCDTIGCHDAFGAEKKHVEPNASPDESYGDCKHSQQLTDLLAASGLKEDYWANYCLRGSQIDFADASGWPTRLGNTQLEPGLFNGRSSCMTCHALAAFDKNGQSTSNAGFLDGKAQLGYPLPEWFYEQPLDPLQPHGPLKALQGDFVWSFDYARPLAPSP
jgi:hypothetical protein